MTENRPSLDEHGRVCRGLAPPEPGDPDYAFELELEASVETTRTTAGAAMRQLVDEDDWQRVADAPLRRMPGRVPFAMLMRGWRLHGAPRARVRRREHRPHARRRHGASSRTASPDPGDDGPGSDDPPAPSRIALGRRRRLTRSWLARRTREASR